MGVMVDAPAGRARTSLRNPSELSVEELQTVVRNFKARIEGYEMGNLADLRVARDEFPSEDMERSLQRNFDQVQMMRERVRPYVEELDRRTKVPIE